MLLHYCLPLDLRHRAQIGLSIGVAPVCPYGYYDYAPYDCAAYGYYGPDWFSGGLFIGAGPWFHGPRGFYGHVDNRYDPRRGYAGPRPERGEQAFNHFHANEARDGRGNVGNAATVGPENTLPALRCVAAAAVAAAAVVRRGGGHR